MLKNTIYTFSMASLMSISIGLSSAYAGGPEMMAAPAPAPAPSMMDKLVFSLSAGGGPTLFNSDGSEDYDYDVDNGGGDIFSFDKDTDLVETQADAVVEGYVGYKMSPSATLGLAFDYFPTKFDGVSSNTTLQDIGSDHVDELYTLDYSVELKDRMALLMRYTYSTSGKWSFGGEAGVSDQKVITTQSSNADVLDHSHDSNHYGAVVGAFTQYNIKNNIFVMGRYMMNYIGTVSFSSTGESEIQDGVVTSTSYDSSQKIYTNSLLFQIGYTI
ncbi:MAG: hypothetical protein CL816_01690 [Coxiellaceae bacterium]|nr:hypothetical protein [Coxiellaceae bacterium]|tara:strand:+ start:4627 stop:5442 length:816 start_codon:yes stop_codon:yes gene_type:complete